MTASGVSDEAAMRGSTSAALPRRPIDSGCFARRAVSGARDRLVEIGEHLVAVAGLEAPPDSVGIDLDREADAAVHRHRQRLRAAHASQTGGHDQTSRADRRRNAAAHTRRTSHRCPAGCPGCRCRSRSRPSSVRTWSGRARRAGETRPTSPISARGSRWRSARGAPPRACGTRPRACRSGPGASRRWRASRASRQSHGRTASCARPCRRRRRRSALPAARRLPDRGCSSEGEARLPDPSRGSAGWSRVERELPSSGS